VIVCVLPKKIPAAAVQFTIKVTVWGNKPNLEGMAFGENPVRE
jgi:hypothetical protein